jgi:hypothetical protein
MRESFGGLEHVVSGLDASFPCVQDYLDFHGILFSGSIFMGVFSGSIFTRVYDICVVLESKAGEYN